MILPINSTIVFDLDDTLYSERDFEKSGIEYVYNHFEIKHIELQLLLNDRKNWIDKIINVSNSLITLDSVIDIYRKHIPTIQLYDDSKKYLEKLRLQGQDISLITDGRSITQRNKLRALGIDSYFKNIVISDEVNSEKPSEYNFKIIMNNINSKKYIYIADNPQKDFITPNRLGWISICLLDRGQNIHKQNFELPRPFLPQIFINTFDDIIL